MAVSYIGTDGFRGVFGEGFFTEKFLEALVGGLKTFWSLCSYKNPVILGYDTRENGPYIAQKLQEFCEKNGLKTMCLGCCGSPELSFYCGQKKSIGLMISASHNPWPYNGLKFFTPYGAKWPYDSLKHLETLLRYLLHPKEREVENINISFSFERWSQEFLKAHYGYGPIFKPSVFSSSMLEQQWATYEDFLCYHGGNLQGLKVVLDGAHGAFYKKACTVFQRCGAEVLDVLGNSPDGHNINDHVGSLYPQQLQERVLFHKNHVGFAFDGDGDRMIAVDHKGRFYDGGHLLGIFSLLFPEGGLIGTNMCNGALKTFCENHCRSFRTVDVGDHHVFKALEEKKWFLGGEPSGHFLMPSLAPTSDGLLAALLLGHLMVTKNLQKIFGNQRYYPDTKGYETSWEPTLVRPFENFLAVEHNEPLGAQDREKLQPFLPQLIKEQEIFLGPSYRIILRFSGTEPVLRFFLEGPSLELLQNLKKNLLEKIKQYLH